MTAGPPDVLRGGLRDRVCAVRCQEFVLALLADVLTCPQIVVGVKPPVIAELSVVLRGRMGALRGETDGRLPWKIALSEKVKAFQLLYGRPLVGLFLEYTRN